MIEKNKRGIYSVFEVSSVILLTMLAFTLIYLDLDIEGKSKSIKVDTIADILILNEDFNFNLLNEDLSVDTISQNWSKIAVLLDNSLTNYELTIKNQSFEKDIFLCDGTYKKTYVKRFVMFYNQTYDFRTFKLALCQ
jgi:hypothetical protein